MPLRREPNAEPIPGYRLIAPLGSGGFGEVWKCEAPGGLYKAIKFVYGNLNTPDDSYQAKQEFAALQRIKDIRHVFVLSTERIEQIGGELLIVMELADKNLHDRLVECQAAGLKGIPRDELLAYLRDAAEALDLFNTEKDLQHLDIKPRNLFVVDRRVKIADFGLVKHLEGMTAATSATGLMGGVTPVYAAPETFQGIISRHSDQYSLAITYQELLTGTRPFNGRTPRQLMLQHMKEAPDLSPLPPADRPIVAKALAKNPQERFACCMDFIWSLKTGQIRESAPRAAPVKGPAARPAYSMAHTMEDLFLSPQDAAAAVGADSGVSPSDLSPEDAVRLGVTVAQPMTGSLRPTLVIGLGSFGLRTLQSLRCRVIDRFGSLAKLPILRFLYLDSDPKGLHSAMTGPPEQALHNGEIQQLQLQPMAYYRKNRAALEQLEQWLPTQKLHSMPRSLEVDGVRALGRLAFAESYNGVIARLRRELKYIVNPNNLDLSVQETGLALRSKVPQVYVVAAAGGGTGSGVLVDLAYAVRRVMQELGYTQPEVVALVQCGAPIDPATPPEEQANLYATLTELHHFSDPATEFTAQYGANAPVLRDAAAPYQAVYLVKMGHRSPAGVQRTAARLASYVYHDLTTPLGIRLSLSRQVQLSTHGQPFRSFGSYTVWFPRGLMLRIAARRACQRLIQAWQEGLQGSNPDLPLLVAADGRHHTAAAVAESQPSLAATLTDTRWSQEVEKRCAELFQDNRWDTSHLIYLLEEAATTAAEGTPKEALRSFISLLSEQIDLALAQDDPAGWCRQALERLREWVGSGVSALEETSEWRRSKLHRLFAAAIQKVSDEYVEFLARPVQELFDRPGYRLAAADAAFTRLADRCEQRIQALQATLQEQRRRTEQCWKVVEQAVEGCLRPGSFLFFPGNRMRRLLKTFMDRLTEYAHQRLTEEVVRSVQAFYAAVQGKLRERQRDLAFCRQRLNHLAETLVAPVEAGEDLEGTALDLESSPPAALASSSQLLGDAARSLASRIVLPEGADDLDLAASQFLEMVTPEQWLELDHELHEKVLTPLGGLYKSCMDNMDLARSLGTPLVEGAAEFLGKHLPVTDVCEAELSAARSLGIDLGAQLKTYYRLAMPSVAAPQSEREQAFLLVPNSEAGQELGEIARKELPHLQVVRVPNQTDLLICREQANLDPEDIVSLVEPCKPAYRRAATTPLSTPHTRCDILDWVPLDP